VKESDVTRQVLLAASERGLTLFRTNCGLAWQGQQRWIRTSMGRALVLEAPRPVHLLPEGFPDYSGWTPDGQFVGLEIKAALGRARKQQLHFQDLIRTAGGLAIVARSPDDLQY
jgi:hypothetical protein